MSDRTLANLRVGEVGQIKSFTDSIKACRFLNMGVLPTTKVKVVRKSPLGDALYIQLENHNIAIRKKEASTIIIEAQ